MCQAVSVYALMRSIHGRRPDWSIGLFSGYSRLELDAGLYDLREPIDHPTIRKTPAVLASIWGSIAYRLDFAILGRYDRTQPVQPLETRPELRMCSSSNQRLVLFSRRYRYDDFPPLSVEYSISDSGLTQVTGYPL